MADLPRQVRLAAGDYFMHGQDFRMRRAGLPGNVCRVVLRMEAGLDVNLLRERVTASPILDWLARVRIVRPLSVLPPLWRATAESRPFFHEHNEPAGVSDGPESLPPAVLGRELYASRGPALALDLVRHKDDTQSLVLSWNHALMDARGAEFIFRHLHADDTAKETSALENTISPEQRNGGLSSWWRSMKSAPGSVEWLHRSGAEPLFTLLPPARPSGPSRNLSRVLLFSNEEMARMDDRCQRLNAVFRRSNFYLAASIRALHTIATQRGNTTGAYLVPVPHDMRRRGASGPIFSNHLSILFYRIEPRQAVNLSEIISELTRQMMDQIRDRFPECCMAALDMFKPLPLGFYLHQLGKPTRGKFATFCFSDSGETCAGISNLIGGRIQSVTHLVPTWRPPGLTVLFWNYAGRLCAQLSWLDECLSSVEADTLERSLRSALLEEVVL
jgi:hypothetical protein